MPSDTQPKNIIIGTAGHVDHGKTSLTERLTGINADRLQEEKERGLTIDLGFAWFTLPCGARAGIVDMPGHERFVKNMLAGATGIDLFLLMVAADEGVMPQTREHLNILSVLEIETGIVVITKADMVDEDMLELVQAEVSEALEGTPFESSPMVVTSAKTGLGFDKLTATLDEQAQAIAPRDIAGPTRMQIDRSFTIRGFGTVVTGSLIRGKLSVDQELDIIPGDLKTRVRSIERYEENIQQAVAPARIGVNLAGLSKDEVKRGDQLVVPGSMPTSWMLDVRLRMADDAGRPLIHRERVRIHHGASEILGRVVLLERDELPPGHDGLAQLRLETPVAAATDDHFVVRRYSPAYTIGGGIVLDPAPSRHRRRRPDVLERLEQLETGTDEARALDWMRTRGCRGFSAEDLAREIQLDADQCDELLDGLLDSRDVIELVPGRYSEKRCADGFLANIQKTLSDFHQKAPLRIAMSANALKLALDSPSPEMLQWGLDSLREAGLIASEKTGWRMATHELALTDAQFAALDGLEKQIADAGMSPPERDEVLATLKAHGDAQALLEVLYSRGGVLPVADFVMDADTLKKAAGALAKLYSEKGAFAVADVRDVWGSTRKYVVPLLEFLDSRGITRREGNLRHVNKRPEK